MNRYYKYKQLGLEIREWTVGKYHKLEAVVGLEQTNRSRTVKARPPDWSRGRRPAPCWMWAVAQGAAAPAAPCHLLPIGLHENDSVSTEQGTGGQASNPR